MNKYLVISALGEDRSGIIKSFSQCIHSLNGNITDSRMTVLGKEFALIILVSGNEAAISAIESKLMDDQQTLGMTVICKRTGTSEKQLPSLPYIIEVVTMDNPGIVHDITDFLAQQKINVSELSTNSYPAAHTGTPMFTMEMSVSVPATLNLSKFKQAFNDFCDELNMDVEMYPHS